MVTTTSFQAAEANGDEYFKLAFHGSCTIPQGMFTAPVDDSGRTRSGDFRLSFGDAPALQLEQLDAAAYDDDGVVVHVSMSSFGGI